MNISVTGVVGLPGNKLVKELLQRNSKVRAFFPPGWKTFILSCLRIQRFEGDLFKSKNFICVKDAAIDIANAIYMGRVGESYILDYQNMKYHESFSMIAGRILTWNQKL